LVLEFVSALNKGGHHHVANVYDCSVAVAKKNMLVRVELKDTFFFLNVKGATKKHHTL